MATILASLYGTEKDKYNCSFYYKIGACRHGDMCSRKHNKPAHSQTILIPNLYHNPSHDPSCVMTKEELQEHFDRFYEDFFVELSLKYGPIDELLICDNVGDHLIGNMYVKFKHGDDAGKACDDLNNRFYAGRPLYVELSPVTDFREATCRQHESDECTRGGFCNFMHLLRPSGDLKRSLYSAQRLEHELRRERR